jgi:hypothetical protein
MDSVLFTRWRKMYVDGKPQFAIMPLSALFERVFVVEDDPAHYQQDIADSVSYRIRGDDKMKSTRKYPLLNKDPVNQAADFCYVCHPVRLWAGEFVQN